MLNNDIIDMRSDAVTRPTDEMRDAMRDAEVGAFMELTEDPTVRRLEEMSAGIMGKEAAILMTSGTQANLVATMAHTRLGDEIMIGENHHHLLQEVGGLAVIANVMPRVMPSYRGVLDPEAVDAGIHPRGTLYNPTGLIWIENTHNTLGGIAIGIDEMRPLVDVARHHGVPIHMDGARIFNAAFALGVEPHEIAAEVDSVIFCLTKCLSCPVGSMLVGSQELINEAGRIRKMLGAGMRQAGNFAAAGIVALETMVDRIAEDNRHALIIAERLEAIEGIEVVPVQTNLIRFDLAGLNMTAADFAKQLAESGILVLVVGKTKIRLAIHRHHGEEEIERTLTAIEQIAEAQTDRMVA